MMTTELRISDDWLDADGHLTFRAYFHASEIATDALLERIGLDEAYRSLAGKTDYVAEAYSKFFREIRHADRLFIESRVARYSEASIHMVHEFRTGPDDPLRAAVDVVTAHVDRTVPKRSRLPDDVLGILEASCGASRPSEGGGRHGRLALRPEGKGAQAGS